MTEQLQTAVAEDYLRTIYKLQQKDGAVSTSGLAAAMNVSSASASDMLKKLARNKLVQYKPYYGASLTEQGLAIALAVTRKHRLWEMFLVESLGFSWDEVHSIADKLEHYTPALLEKRIDEKLGFPTVDPHGDPIPRSNGEVPEDSLILLAGLPPHTPARISRVSDDSPEILQYLAKIGMTLGQNIVVRENIPFDNTLHIDLEGKELFLSQKLAQSIFVTLHEPEPS